MTSAFDNPNDMMKGAKNVGEGWHHLIRDLENILNDLDPNYRLHQVKEKFGGLRYYADTQVEENLTAFMSAVSVYEDQSFKICEVCGEPGQCVGSKGWIKTLCHEHRQEEISRRH